MQSESIAPLRSFVIRMTQLIDATSNEARLLQEGKTLLRDLISTDDWLPSFCAQPHAEHYQQYLLHADPLERFSIVSFVWGPGQKTPIHDHTTWGLIGVLRGAEQSVRYERRADGTLSILGEPAILRAGQIDAVSPSIGDIHLVANAERDMASISIHVYGANIGATPRHVFDPHSGQSKDFISGYAADIVPNLWDRSTALRTQPI